MGIYELSNTRKKRTINALHAVKNLPKLQGCLLPNLFLNLNLKSIIFCSHAENFSIKST